MGGEGGVLHDDDGARVDGVAVVPVGEAVSVGERNGFDDGRVALVVGAVACGVAEEVVA